MSITQNKPVSRRRLESQFSQVRMCLSALVKEEKLVKGVLYPLRRKCGKSQCKCAQSDYRHESWYLSFSDHGKTRVVYVPEEDRKELIDLTKRYKSFRLNRQKLVETFKGILHQVNNLERIKTLPYPKEVPNDRRSRNRRRKSRSP
jgi:hypothetical protein